MEMSLVDIKWFKEYWRSNDMDAFNGFNKEYETVVHVEKYPYETVDAYKVWLANQNVYLVTFSGGNMVHKIYLYQKMEMTGEIYMSQLMNKIHNIYIDKFGNQEYFAEALGVSQGTVSNWLTRTFCPNLGQIYNIASVLGVELSFFTDIHTID